MGINTEGYVNHPIVLTEAVCNPNYCRQREYHHFAFNGSFIVKATHARQDHMLSSFLIK